MLCFIWMGGGRFNLLYNDEKRNIYFFDRPTGDEGQIKSRLRHSRKTRRRRRSHHEYHHRHKSVSYSVVFRFVYDSVSFITFVRHCNGVLMATATRVNLVVVVVVRLVSSRTSPGGHAFPFAAMTSRHYAVRTVTVPRMLLTVCGFLAVSVSVVGGLQHRDDVAGNLRRNSSKQVMDESILYDFPHRRTYGWMSGWGVFCFSVEISRILFFPFIYV